MSRYLPLQCIAVCFFVVLSACDGRRPAAESATASADTLQMNTKADSVGMHVYSEFGGPDAWASLPYLRFDFAGGDETSRNLRASHLWDRVSGDYRVEMQQAEDTVYVALFNVNSREGSVYLDGAAVNGAHEAELLESAYRRYINDAYWLLMPVKMFDPGVSRTYVADSSTADVDVLRLSFEGVGLTPGDQYWVYVDRETGRVDRWAYRLQHHDPDHVPQPIQWTDYKTLQAPQGEILVSERKVGPGFVIYTDNVAAPSEIEEGAFTDPMPMLSGS